MDPNLSEMQTQLATWVQQKMPQAKNVIVSELQKPGMGLSSETYLFDMSWEEAGQPKSKGVVLRAAPWGQGSFPEYDLGLQFRIMRILDGTKVPVAKMLWLEEDPSKPWLNSTSWIGKTWEIDFMKIPGGGTDATDQAGGESHVKQRTNRCSRRQDSFGQQSISLEDSQVPE